MQSYKGFTLIELMVVIIIVSILASVAIPMMSGYTKKAIMTEAIAALGTLRVAEKAYYLEYGAYCDIDIPTGGYVPGRFVRLGLTDAELDGQYFGNSCYGAIPASGPVGYPVVHRVSCAPSYGVHSAPKAYIVNEWEIIHMHINNGQIDGD